MVSKELVSIKHSVVIILKEIFKGWTIWKAINFSNLLKLLFLYIVSIIMLLIIELRTSKHFFSKALNGNLSSIKLAVYGVKDRIGERVLYHRMINTLENEGYDYVSMQCSEPLMNFWLTKHFYSIANSLVNYVFDITYNIATTHYVKILPYGYNITYLNVPRHMLYDLPLQFKPMFAHLKGYNAYIDLYSLVNGKNEILEKLTTKDQNIIPLYFAHEDSKYQESIIDKALITGSLWGCNRSSLSTMLALKTIAQDDLLVAYGLKYSFIFLDTNYKGPIDKIKGHVSDNMDDLHRKYGIALIMHSYEHLIDGIPTSRVSEAASTGALIISDRSKFLEKYFGDNVLYIDTISQKIDARELANQIKNHILWARNNPNEVRKMTRNVHDIFQQNFTMEKQFEQLFNILASNYQ